jgi:hypothetical protein
MSEKNCQACRYWEANEPPFRKWNPEAWGNCELARSENGEAVNAAALVVAQDLEGCSAWLKTAAAFGCVQWEAKG